MKVLLFFFNKLENKETLNAKRWETLSVKRKSQNGFKIFKRHKIHSRFAKYH